MTKIICTLPPSFRHFISTWDNVPEPKKMIALLNSRLLKEESMTKMFSNGEPDATDAAFFARNTHPHGSSSRGAYRGENRGGNRGGCSSGYRGGYRGGKSCLDKVCRVNATTNTHAKLC